MRALFFFLLALPSAMLAQQPDRPGVESGSHTKQLVQSAELAFRSGDFLAALEDYSLAYSLSQDDALLLEIAQCHVKLGEYQQAIKRYEEYLSANQGELSREHRQEIESLLLEAQELSEQKRDGHYPAGLNPNIDKEQEPLFWSHKPHRAAAPYFAASGISLLAAAVSATFAIQVANTIEAESESELVSTEQLRQSRTLSILLATGADVLVVTSAITATVGVLKWRDQKRELSARASANSVSIQLRY